MNTKWLHEYHTTHDNMLSNKIEQSCRTHHRHHKSVNSDMKLNGLEKKNDLFFNWFNTFISWVFYFIISFIPVKLFRIPIPIKTHLFFTIILTLLFVLFWNTFHPTMHKSGIDILFTEGAPNLKIDILDNTIYYNNHESHHNIKGDDKGNYNVVFLGFDDIMGTNHIFSKQSSAL